LLRDGIFGCKKNDLQGGISLGNAGISSHVPLPHFVCQPDAIQLGARDSSREKLLRHLV